MNPPVQSSFLEIAKGMLCLNLSTEQRIKINNDCLFGHAIKNFVRMVQPRFAPLVLSGEKLQTVRLKPKRMPKPGDTISLRMWSGVPYRSKQRVLRESVIVRVDDILIDVEPWSRCDVAGIFLNGKHLSGPKALSFAKADGFIGLGDFTKFFNVTHGLPFEGIVIVWQNTKE